MKQTFFLKKKKRITQFQFDTNIISNNKNILISQYQYHHTMAHIF